MLGRGVKVQYKEWVNWMWDKLEGVIECKGVIERKGVIEQEGVCEQEGVLVFHT